MINYPLIPLEIVAPLSRGRIVYRAFDHLIAPFAGGLLFIPVAQVLCNLNEVIDRCPLPWDEIWAVLDTPVEDAREILEEGLHARWPQLAALFPRDWSLDFIGLGNSQGQRKTIERLSHPSGVRYVRVETKNQGGDQ
ncbi:hypothetical protein [Propionivibrio sp.]|uniref:hypothetical protein n=1 Tax=Propionivibrio sp. TaxID=2212460 RepID=UPI0039E43F76